MRTVDVNIGGNLYPMCFTLQAYSDFLERYGSMDVCVKRTEELAKSGKDRELLDEYLWMGNRLLQCGYLRAMSLGQELPDCPDADALMDAMTPAELRIAVAKALVLGQIREVEAVAPKNAGGAGGATAPEN